MGARQSYLYIYLKNKVDVYKEDVCSITPSKAVVDGSIDFEVVTYNINYNGRNGTDFDIYIYDTEKKDSSSSYIFAYCSPSSSQVAKEVKVYYSVLAPTKPLIISFVIQNNHTYKCEIGKLMSARWDWASSITEYVITGDLITNLKDQYKKLLRNRTIQFVKAEKESDDVLGYQQEIGKDKKKYRIICTPSGEKSVLNSNCLFTFNTKLKDKYEEPKIQPGCQKPQDNGKNQIDPYFLAPVYGKYFDGIIIYFARDSPKNEKTIDEKHDANTALYLEFIDLREKDICFKRKDKNGYLWAEEKIDYKDDTALESQLGTICTALNDEVNTCILDMKESYKGPTVKTEETTQAYIKYTHTYSKENKCTFIFGRKETEIPKLKGNSLKTACVEVYYLKAKDKEDDEPFLVSFEVKESQPKTKAYHFKNDGEFKNWVEFVNKKKEKPEKEQQDDLKNELKERLGELATSGSCSPNLFWLRIVAYQILTYEKPSPAPPVTVPEEKKRPDLYKPEDVPDPPPLEWIITGSVGGVVFVGSSAVGYGVYWYNTTIRLLT